MPMCTSAARQAMPLSRAPHAQRSKAKRQRHRAARLRTPAPERIARTRALSDSATSWLTPMVVLSLLGGAAAVATIVLPLQGAIKEGIQTLETKQTASGIALDAKLDAKLNNFTSALQVELGKLESKVDTNTNSVGELKSEVNTKLGELNTKLDSFSTNLQAQQVQTADLKGQVTILRDCNRDGDKKK